MKISYDKMSYLADKITRALMDDDAFDMSASREEIFNVVMQALRADGEREEAIEKHVREKISSIKRKIEEGSSEWNALYRKYYEEETAKLNIVKKTW